MNRIFLNNMFKEHGVGFQQHRDVTYIDELLLDDKGRLQPVRASALAEIPHQDLVYYCTVRGFYSIPTIELMELIKGYMPMDSSALEIGAGNGVYGRNFRIRMTDNFMQHPKNRGKFKNCIQAYESAGQCLVPYGADVEEMDGREAVRLRKPRHVFCAWVTQKYNPMRPHKKGNMFGVSFDWILKRASVQQIVMVGNKNVHSNIDIMDVPHEEIRCDDILFSRASQEGNDRIFIWNK